MKVYVIAHKKFEMPQADYLVPMQVGAEGKERLGYLTDDEGENISGKNPNYCELTGIYQIWKNRSEGIVGICHYRRYFCNAEGKLFTKEELLEELSRADVLVSEYVSSEQTMKEEYIEAHTQKDYDILEQVVAEVAPDYREAFETVMQGHGMYIGNMMICNHKIFEQYCAFLFPVLFEAEKRVDLTGYNDYQKRIFGFMAERLLTVWLTKHREYRVQPCKIGLWGEKAEKKELFSVISSYLKEGKAKEALAYYDRRMEERPDIAKNMTGADMEVIMAGHILRIDQRERKEQKLPALLACPYEQEAFLNYSPDIRELITHYTNLYGLLHYVADGKDSGLFCTYVAQKKVSAAAICSIMQFGSFHHAQREQLYGQISYIFFQTGMLRRALRVVEEGLEYVPGQTELLSNKGCILLALKEREQARETFLRIPNPPPQVRQLLEQL